MKQFVLVLFVLAAPAAAGRITFRPPIAAAEAKLGAGYQPKEVLVFFSEDRTDKPCAWLQ